jgi:hypothetical protein
MNMHVSIGHRAERVATAAYGQYAQQRFNATHLNDNHLVDVCVICFEIAVGDVDAAGFVVTIVCLRDLTDVSRVNGGEAVVCLREGDATVSDAVFCWN